MFLVLLVLLILLVLSVFKIADWFFYTPDEEIDRKIHKVVKFIGGDQ